MLLLLRGTLSASPAASLGIVIGLSGIAGPTASVGINLGLTPPNEFELSISGTPSITFGLTGISSGLLGRSATLDTILGLTAPPAQSVSQSVSLVFGLSGTVGSFVQNSGTVGITLGLSGAIGVLPTASLDTVLGLTGAPVISGGTVSSAASLGTQFGLSVTNLTFAVNGNMSVSLDLDATGTAFGQGANLPKGPYISGVGLWDITIRTYG